MNSHERYRRMDAARVHAELTVQDLWLSYVALCGTGDAFDLDGYLQGLVPLDSFQQDVLAQALNEALEEGYRAHLIPLSTPPALDVSGQRLDQLLSDLFSDLLGDRSPAPRTAEPPGCDPS